MVTPPTLNGPVFEVVSSLAARIAYGAGKSLLHGVGLPTSLGWDRTIRAATNAAANMPAAPTIVRKLTAAFATHTLVGEKLIRYYGFAGIPTKEKADYKATLKKAPAIIKIPNSPFSKRYPLAVFEKADLRQLEGKTPIITAVFSSSNSIVFQFCSVRSFRERIPLDITDFNADDREMLEDYTEVIGIRPIRRQCFDTVIWHLDREIVEIRIDAPEGISSHQQRAALSSLIDAFDNLKLFATGWSPFGGAPINFHKLMDSLYRKKSEGTVFQLGFTATTQTSSSNNGARLLRKKNQDLRKDAFHAGGANAVQDISPYTIGVEWHEAGFTMSPKLIVPGNVKMLYTSPIIFPEVVVRDCFTEQEFVFITNKIEKYR